MMLWRLMVIVTLTLRCFQDPSYSSGTLITKGDNQFGIHQTGRDSLEFYVMTRSKHKVQIALPQTGRIIGI